MTFFDDLHHFFAWLFFLCRPAKRHRPFYLSSFAPRPYIQIFWGSPKTRLHVFFTEVYIYILIYLYIYIYIYRERESYCGHSSGACTTSRNTGVPGHFTRNKQEAPGSLETGSSWGMPLSLFENFHHFFVTSFICLFRMTFFDDLHHFFVWLFFLCRSEKRHRLFYLSSFAPRPYIQIFWGSPKTRLHVFFTESPQVAGVGRASWLTTASSLK